MGIKIFSKVLSGRIEELSNALAKLESEIAIWQKEQKNAPKNVQLVQSLRASEIVITVWYDD